MRVGRNFRMMLACINLRAEGCSETGARLAMDKVDA
jgi:hypothetical protein